MKRTDAMRIRVKDEPKGVAIKEAPAGRGHKRYPDLSTLVSSIADAIIALGLLSA
jgi:hypothetical protein